MATSILPEASAPAKSRAKRATPRATRSARQRQADCLSADDQAIVDAARAVLERQLRKPGVAVTTPAAASDLARMHLGGLRAEYFGVLFLDAQSRLLSFEKMFRGSLTHCHAYPREVLIEALRLGAASVILAHNHPSGCAEPSPADEYLTGALRKALAMIDIRVLDHLIVGDTSVMSFAERGLL